MARGTPGKVFQPHRLYSWDDLGAMERKQLRGGLPDDITKPRYFAHMGIWFDSEQFDKTPDGSWFTDGSPVHIRWGERGALQVGIQLYGRIIRVQPLAQPEPYKGKASTLKQPSRKLAEPLPPHVEDLEAWRATPPNETKGQV